MHFGIAMTPHHHWGIGVVGKGLLDDSLMLEPAFHADIVLMGEDFSVWKTFVGVMER